MSALRRQAEQLLHDVFHLQHLRPGQKKAVHALLGGRDVLCVMPTGGGKSLCYQLPALVLEGCALVISPLIALMQDQVRALTALGIPAACLNSLQPYQERQRLLDSYRRGLLKLLYIAPERLAQPGFQAMLRQFPPSMLVVDEAHCVIQWGASFRPDYLSIGTVLESLPRRPIVCAMTATADREIQRALVQSLHLRRPVRVDLPLVRPNLRYQAVWAPDTMGFLLPYLRRHALEQGILFCRTREESDDLAQLLARRGFSCAAYHAGMTREMRAQRQQAFTAGTLRILCATSAFGMGIDLPHIRYVILLSPPSSMLDLAQQLGRAGRDGQPADCLTLLRGRDMDDIRRLYQATFLTTPRLKRNRACRELWAQQRAVLRWCLSGRCLSAALSRHFGHASAPCGRCSVCQRNALGDYRPLAPMPPLPDCLPGSLEYWTLIAEREAMAREMNVLPRDILTDRELTALYDGHALPRERLSAAQERRLLRVLQMF